MMQRVEPRAEQRARDGSQDDEGKKRDLFNLRPETEDQRNRTANDERAADQLAPEDIAFLHEDGNPLGKPPSRRDRLIGDYGGDGWHGHDSNRQRFDMRL